MIQRPSTPTPTTANRPKVTPFVFHTFRLAGWDYTVSVSQYDGPLAGYAVHEHFHTEQTPEEALQRTPIWCGTVRFDGCMTLELFPGVAIHIEHPVRNPPISALLAVIRAYVVTVADQHTPDSPWEELKAQIHREHTTPAPAPKPNAHPPVSPSG